MYYQSQHILSANVWLLIFKQCTFKYTIQIPKSKKILSIYREMLLYETHLTLTIYVYWLSGHKASVCTGCLNTEHLCVLGAVSTSRFNPTLQLQRYRI